MLQFIPAILSAATAVVTTVSTWAPAVAKVATKIPQILTTIEKVAQVVSTVATAVDVIKEPVVTDELGRKAIAAEKEGVTIDSFEGDYDKYIAEINKFEIDEEFSATKVESYSAGLTILLGAVSSKLEGVDIESMFDLIAMNPEVYNAEKIKSYTDLVVQEKTTFNELYDYHNDNLSRSNKAGLQQLLQENEI